VEQQVRNRTDKREKTEGKPEWPKMAEVLRRV
jgi:hypothetical protein